MINFNVTVMNRNTAICESFQPHSGEFCIISISTPKDRTPDFFQNSNCKDVLKLVFDDVVDKRENGQMMTEEDAKRVAEFCQKNVDKGISNFWVHCDAGISRSAGVAAAILKYYTEDDTQIYDNPKYCPNCHCYRMVLNALHDTE